MDYQLIRDDKDASAFLSEVNGLHDGYIVSVNYQHQGYTWGNPLYIDPKKTGLILTVMVTSIDNTLVEMSFEHIKDLQIRNIGYELLDSSISISEDGFITWCGDSETTPGALHDSVYVIAKVMKWKIVS